jgi:hypothetical protein
LTEPLQPGHRTGGCSSWGLRPSSIGMIGSLLTGAISGTRPDDVWVAGGELLHFDLPRIPRLPTIRISLITNLLPPIEQLVTVRRSRRYSAFAPYKGLGLTVGGMTTPRGLGRGGPWAERLPCADLSRSRSTSNAAAAQRSTSRVAARRVRPGCSCPLARRASKHRPSARLLWGACRHES